MTAETRRPPHTPDGIVTAGPWRGHWLGCITAGCDATKCSGAGVTRRLEWLDETADLRRGASHVR